MSANSAKMDRRGFLKGAAALGGAAAVMGLSGCVGNGVQEGSQAAVSGTASGVFGATAKSLKGDIKVFVTLDEGTITDVSVVDDVDSDVIKDAAIESIARRVVEQQNIEVDAVSGATMTSMAILNGIETALDDAGIDMRPWQKGSDAVIDKERKDAVECDVVIVGSGLAGLNAAITLTKDSMAAVGGGVGADNEGAEAAKEGLKVIVVEKQAYTGGSSRVCGGGIWATGSKANETVGIDCTKEEYIDFMTMRSDPVEVNAELMGNLYDASGEAFDYLFDWGFPVDVTTVSVAADGLNLPIFGGTVRQQTPWENGNVGFMDFMTTLCTNAGVDIRTNTRAVKINAAGGAVSGIEVEDLESAYTINAKKVILASGGFTRNPDMIERLAPEFSAGFAFTGSGSIGDGIAMGEEIGAAVYGTGMMGLYGLNSEVGYYGAVGNTVFSPQFTVNAEGEEFGMAGLRAYDTLVLLCQQTGGCGYGICDSTAGTVDRLELAVEAGLVAKYDSLEALAESEGIAPEGLAACAEANGVSAAPFYCVVQRPLFIGSIPGLKVGSRCEVLDESGAAIENLYAAGELMFCNSFNKQYPAGGSGLGTSCYSGAVAAKAILEALG